MDLQSRGYMHPSHSLSRSTQQIPSTARPTRLSSRRPFHCRTKCSIAVAEPSISTKTLNAQGQMRLVMMRHAESEERLQGIRDHDRPITDEGRSSAREVAAKLAERGWLPDVIVSSDSTRTKQTLAMMAEAHPAFQEAATLFRGSLYTVAALDGQTRKHLQEVVTAEVDQRAEQVQCVLCLGHNKGMEEAATSLAGNAVRLETANAALLQKLGDSWQEALAEEHAWDLVEVLIPKSQLQH
ncbi:hypothetical protein CVIRNUC_010676 [Coccomyxa viridis]|uniref:Uncharacterized protein n=1 Tax=Coccomyxa viridis TaxID=1274662 RepID=A0AAV1IJF0_9CHLO|nr:hypothetical protein CVIRNUC_010676 [Coccomyxa viridis]